MTEVRKTILVVDDDKTTNRLLCDLIRMHPESDLDPIPVLTFSAAVEVLRVMHVDCIVLDVLLPNGEGLAPLLKLKKSDYQDIPVLIVTGLPEGLRPSKEQFLKAGANVFLEKPVHQQELVEAILRSMEAHQVAKENSGFHQDKQIIEDSMCGLKKLVSR